TDLDRFSSLEIRSLVRHGYCVGRKVCRTRPELFGGDMPASAPWDPYPEAASPAPAPSHAAATERPRPGRALLTTAARELQQSALRRIWSTLLDYRDWTSYIYVPLLVPILVVLPYASVKFYKHQQRIDQIVQSLTQSSQDLEQMSRLIQGPVPRWTSGAATATLDTATRDDKGFTILQDLRIIDLRNWKPAKEGDSGAYLYGYRRMKVLGGKDNTANNLFSASVLAQSPKTQVRFPPQVLTPTLFLHMRQTAPDSAQELRWQVHADFTRIPPGESVDIMYEHQSPG